MMRFCGACGGRLASWVDAEGNERQRCPACGWNWIDALHSVVLLLGITPDGRVLFTRRHSWPKGWGDSP